MKQPIQELKTSEISSKVYVISPTQIDFISSNFGDAVAQAMNIKPMAARIRQIASETLKQVLQNAKTMGE